MRQTRQLSESCRNREDQKKVAAQRRPTPHCDKPFCEKFGKSEACTNRGLADAAVQAIAWLTFRQDHAVVCFSVSARQARVMSNGCCGVYRVVPSTREDKVGHAGISEDDFNDRSVPDLLFRFSVATQAELKNVYGPSQGKHGLGAGR